MRIRHLVDYFRLSRMLENGREASRFQRDPGAANEFEMRFRDGRRLVLRGGTRDGHVFDRIFLRDTYHLDRFQTSLGCVLDVGANIGIFTCRVVPMAKRVICLEPSPSNIAMLSRNVGGDEKVSVMRAALSASVGEATLSGDRSGEFTLHAEGDDAGAEDSFQVQTTTLDHVYEAHGIEHCDLIKIDIEGAEYEALYAASPDALSRTGAIVGEYHPLSSPEPGANITALTEYLEKHGFQVSHIPSKRKQGLGLFFAYRAAP